MSAAVLGDRAEGFGCLETVTQRLDQDDVEDLGLIVRITELEEMVRDDLLKLGAA